eukprot:TRINITY_DN92296_c0_g1_i1.p1 TRINITY_DN92296_c0_g1~~TRINITY_DN92296_c0_g1_i1.p1  ORF type:complete len:534 (+),score=90.03 TRINITY_DN92296_c0_g1_i1:208-1602(+)
MFLFMSSFTLSMPLYGEIMLQAPRVQALSSDTERMKLAQMNLSIAISFNSIFELLSCGFIGVLCDRIGRRPVALLTQLGQLIDYSVAALSADPQHGRTLVEHPGAAIIMARSIAGVLGAIKVPLQAYVADASKKGNHAVNYGKVSTAVGLGLIFGPALNTAALHKFGGSLRPALLCAVAMTLVNMCLICWKWPGKPQTEEAGESGRKKATSWQEANPYWLIRNTIFQTCKLRMFGCMNLMDAYSMSLLLSTLPLFTKRQFGWEPAMMSVFLLVLGVLTPIQIVGIMNPLVRLYGETFVLQVGYVATCMSYLLLFFFGLTNVGGLLFIFVFVFTLGNISNPAQMGLAIQEMEPEHRGRLSSALSVCETLGKAFAPFLGSFVISKTIGGPLPSLLYLVSALFMAPAVAMAFWLPSLDRDTEKEAEPARTPEQGSANDDQVLPTILGSGSHSAVVVKRDASFSFASG